jgi:hypothetical protein
VLAVILFALAVWRFPVFWRGPEEAFLQYEPPPERAEYLRLRALQEELMARQAAGDQTVDPADIEAAYQAQVDLYSVLVQAEADRWEAARRVEFWVWVPAGLTGIVLLLVAGALLVVPLVFPPAEDRQQQPQRTEPRPRRPVGEPPPIPSGATAVAEGWTDKDPEHLRFLLDHAPPRPYGYLRQFWIDAQHRKVYVFWGAGLAAVAVGWAFEQWLMIPAGVFVLGAYVRCLMITVRMIREIPVVAGVVPEWDDPPRLNGFETATALTADGQEVSVAAHRRPFGGAINPDATAEVLFLHQPAATYSTVIAVRRARAHPQSASGAE